MYSMGNLLGGDHKDGPAPEFYQQRAYICTVLKVLIKVNPRPAWCTSGSGYETMVGFHSAVTLYVIQVYWIDVCGEVDCVCVWGSYGMVLYV